MVKHFEFAKCIEKWVFVILKTFRPNIHQMDFKNQFLLQKYFPQDYQTGSIL